jgi:bacterioferritin (cytochrome b1)
MKGSVDVIKVLNEVLRKELTGINQYFIHSKIDEEHHVDWIESQVHQIQEVGYENYLAQQIFKRT